MTSIIETLHKHGLIKPPSFVIGGTQLEVQTGSVAYGTSGEDSDVDLYGFCIPDRATVFPYSDGGEILGFGTQKPRFEQFSQHHIKDNNKEYDVTVYNIVKYFQLTLECNPNMIDTLFVPVRCVLHITRIGNLVRDNRKLFLHKGAWHKFKGYAYSMVNRYKPETRDALKPIFVFQKRHKITAENCISNLQRELTRRGLDAKYNQRFNRNDIR